MGLSPTAPQGIPIYMRGIWGSFPLPNIYCERLCVVDIRRAHCHTLPCTATYTLPHTATQGRAGTAAHSRVHCHTLMPHCRTLPHCHIRTAALPHHTAVHCCAHYTHTTTEHCLTVPLALLHCHCCTAALPHKFFLFIWRIYIYSFKEFMFIIHIYPSKSI
jgi:hypothetical protein